ncbi:hypothetical protein OG873_30110 [Streptomyces violaceus]|uniref:hypothetical protein n=1 Tax=Streptomyces violaceus TaxID=1936 RepID=UPI002E27B4B7|nr:hypothetical protein [Streptomyces violaceus]
MVHGGHPDAVPPAHAGPDGLATRIDVVNTRNGRTAAQKHRSTGVTAAVTSPSGHAYRPGTFTGAAVRPARDGTTATGAPPSATPGGSPPTPATARGRTSRSPAR